MAEILLCVRDMGADSGEPIIEHRRPKRGDVVAVCEDGWPWGELEIGGRWADPENRSDDVGFVQGELVYTEIVKDKRAVRPVFEHPRGNHNCFRVIKLPRCTVTELAVLASPELNIDPRKQSPYLQYRSFFIDKSKIPFAVQKRLRDFWDDDFRVDGSITLNVTWAQLQSLISQRERVAF